jgi:phosphatidylinositol glycan class O
MLIVMGDHGQTLNGDHGGGTAEEVETTMFAMSTKKHTTLVPPEFDTSSCKQNKVIVTCETYSLVIIRIDF